MESRAVDILSLCYSKLGRVLAIAAIFAPLPFRLGAQGVLLDIPIRVSDPFGAGRTLHIGVDSSASTGLDSQFGEIELPPFPPSGVFEARLIGDDIGRPQLGQGVYRDYLPGSEGFSGTVLHELRFQPQAGDTVIISWALPKGVTGALLDLFGGVFISRQLAGNDSVLIAQANAVSRLKIQLAYDNLTIALSAPRLACPADGASGLALPLQLFWYPVPGAMAYELQIIKIDPLPQVVVSQPDVIDTSFSVPTLETGVQYYWRVRALADSSISEWSDSWKISIVSATHVENERSPAPQSLALLQNYPNPFNPATTIPFYLPWNDSVTLSIYAANGQKVAEILHASLPAGAHRVHWRPTHAATGTYFAILSIGQTRVVRKLVYLK